MSKEEKAHIAKDTGNGTDIYMLAFASKIEKPTLCGKTAYEGLGIKAVDIIYYGGKFADKSTLEDICPDCLNKYKERDIKK